MSALERFRTAKFIYGEYRVFKDLGRTYLEIGDFEKSLDAFLKAVAFSRDSNIAATNPKRCNDFGKLYEQLNDLPRAAALLHASAGICEKPKNRF